MVNAIRGYSQRMLNSTLRIPHTGAKSLRAGIRTARAFSVVPSDEKIQQLVTSGKFNQPISNISLKAYWGTPPEKIIVKTTPSHVKIPDTKPVHLFFGEISALMAAAKKKVKHPDSLITYVTNGNISKSMQSGHQVHNHFFEFITEDCNKRNLIKTMAQGLKISPSPDPAHLKHYPHLHFPNLCTEFLNDPIEQIKLYTGFFKQRILHDLTSTDGVSTREQDRSLCRVIEKSLNFHEILSGIIEAKAELKTLKPEFRIYWSDDHEGIAQKAAKWKELGIKCKKMPYEDIINRTLLRLDQNLAVLKIYGDVQFEQETPKQNADFNSDADQESFDILKAKVQRIYLNPKSQTPEAVKVKEFNGHVKIIPVKDVFGSIGHDQVYKYDAITNSEKQLWKSVPVSGVSSLWQCAIPQKELESRWKLPEKDRLSLIKHLSKLCASANLCNLNLTVLESEICDGNVLLYVRVSQGATINSTVAFKNDLFNMATKLDQFFIGNWGLISAGTCTRQIGVENIPTMTDELGYDYSGLGYSALVPPDLEDPKPSLFD